MLMRCNAIRQARDRIMASMPETIAEDQIQTQQPQPHRRRHRLLWIIGSGLVLVILAAVVTYQLAGSSPSWYRQTDATVSEQGAGRAFEKLAGIHTWAAQRHAWDWARSKGNRPLVKEPAAELTVVITQDDVNSLLGKWYESIAEEKVSGRRLADQLQMPRIRITEDRITLAGTVPPLGGRVVSVDLHPGLTADGKIDLQLMGVRSGSVAIPELAWGKLRDMAIDQLPGIIKQFRSGASMDRGGGMSLEGASVVLARQGMDVLGHRPTVNVLLLPVLSDNVAMPARVSNSKLQMGSLTLTLTPLNAQEREELLKRAKAGME
jgi:hypothetical protein